MKKNLLLFGVLIILLVVTYFFQEKRAEKDYYESLVQGRIVPEEMKTLNLNGIPMEKRNNQWWSGQELLSHNTLKQVERKLLEVKEVKKVEGGEWKDFFPNPITVQINGLSYTFGEMSLDKKGFYVARDKQILLARIEGENTELVSDEHEIDATKYKELKALLTKTLPELKENQLFRFYPNLPSSSISFKMEGRLDFELDFKNNTTVPPPVPGVEAHEKLQDKFLTLLTQFTIKEEVPYDPKLKFKEMGAITFHDDKSKVTWGLWLKNDKSADAFIVDDESKRAFAMVGGTLKGFFLNVQDFWDKKVIPPAKFKSFNRLSMLFREGDREAEVFLINANPLRFEVKGKKVVEEKMHELMTYLFNLGPRDQSDRVSLLSKTERQQVLSENHLKVEVLGEEILFWSKQQEVILVNLTQGFKAHFTLLDKTMEFKFQDVIK